jgi:uncharacterized protein YebE (UPF0316 family)
MRPPVRKCQHEPMEALMDSVKMAGLAIVSVSLWTLRVALTARDRKVAGSLTAGLEAVVFVLAFSQVAADLKAIEKLLGYAVGVALGTLTGLFLDEKLSAGQSEVRVVTEGHDLTHVGRLQDAGWPVTWVRGRGPTGDVTVAFVAVDDNRLPLLVAGLRELAPEAFWTIERLRSARTGRDHAGWLQVGQRQGLNLFPWRAPRPVG